MRAWAAVDDGQVVGLREAHEHHLPEITIAALRYARANDRTFPGPVDKRGAELLYRVGDLKRWARNRPRAAVGTWGWHPPAALRAAGADHLLPEPASIGPSLLHHLPLIDSA